MTDLQLLVKQTSNPSILKMQQRLHKEVVELGKLALQWREGCEALQLALEVERDAANLYAKQVAHWIEKHDAVLIEAKRFRALRDMECAMCPPDRLSYYINNYGELDDYIARMNVAKQEVGNEPHHH